MFRLPLLMPQTSLRRPAIICLLVAGMTLASSLPEALAAESRSLELVAQGYQQLASGRYQSAVETLSAALQSDSSSVLARRYLAHSLLRAGQPASAAANFEMLSRLQPADAADRAALGDAYMQAGDPSRAVSAYLAALRINPLLDAACGGLIQSYLALGRRQEAMDLCAEVLLRTNSPASRRYFIHLLHELHEHEANPGGPETDSVSPAQSRG